MSDDLSILSYNPAGLWWGSEGSNQTEIKKGRIDLELPFIEEKFGMIDVICMQETHISKEDMEVIPNTLYGYAWMHEPARSKDDRAAGVSIGYKHWMPKPTDLTQQIWKNIHMYSDRFGDMEYLKGRLMIVGMELQDKNIAIANFYGFTVEDKFKENSDHKK